MHLDGRRASLTALPCPSGIRLRAWSSVACDLVTDTKFLTLSAFPLTLALPCSPPLFLI